MSIIRQLVANRVSRTFDRWNWFLITSISDNQFYSMVSHHLLLIRCSILIWLRHWRIYSLVPKMASCVKITLLVISCLTIVGTVLSFSALMSNIMNKSIESNFLQPMVSKNDTSVAIVGGLVEIIVTISSFLVIYYDHYCGTMTFLLVLIWAAILFGLVGVWLFVVVTLIDIILMVMFIYELRTKNRKQLRNMVKV